MGNRRFKNRRGGGSGKDRGKGRGPRRPGKPLNYADIVKENDTYVEYYKAQKIVPPEEWEIFMAAIRDELPAAFRINRCCMGQTLKLRDMINDESFSAIVNPDGKKVSAVAVLPWDKEGLSYQFNYSRVEIRKSEALQRLHSFLVSESENGYISRQEAVSMIPPLVLDIQPHHKVLDACAAPGSKTAQIIELLDVNLNNLESNQHNTPKSLSTSTGMVVANDVDNKRCYMLVHQAKRLHSPCFIITNHDAGGMPNFYTESNGTKSKIKFDRILCDAPCTGDGTIRKNIDVWTKWTIPNGNNFHNIQLRIGRRSLEMLAKDGMMVYSTCSLNPVEDEAVVASLLTQAQGTVELVDVSERLPGLKYLPGLDTWVVMQKELKVVNSYAEVEENYRPQIRETMFPPKNAKELNLNRCMRILPHYHNTGGFFVAVFRKKVDYLPWEKIKEVVSNSDTENTKLDEPIVEEPSKPDPPTKRPRRSLGFREDPFFFLTPETEEWIEIKKFFKISDDFPVNQLVVRSKGAKRNIYFVTSSAREIILNNETNVKFINAGVRLFCRSDDKVCDCGYRITQEGLASLFPYLDKDNMVALTASELALLMSQEMTQHEELEQVTREKLATLPSGCAVAVYREQLNSKAPNGEIINHEMVIPLCIWKGKSSVRPFVSKTERIHFLRICGGDTKELELEEMKRFQDKQERKQARINERNQQQLAEEELKSKEIKSEEEEAIEDIDHQVDQSESLQIKTESETIEQIKL